MLSRLLELLDRTSAERVQLEITEQSPIEDYDRLLAACGALRERGVRVAVDDAGAGYACLRHILRLAPDVIKLDMALTRDVDSDPAREALAASLVSFSQRVGSRLIAEGVETQSELDKLASLGVQAAQGHLLARPRPAAGADRRPAGMMRQFRTKQPSQGSEQHTRLLKDGGGQDQVSS